MSFSKGTTPEPDIIPVDTGKPSLLEEFIQQRDAARMALTDAHYAAIGRVATEWSYFEHLIDHWCIFFAKIETEIGICFTAQSMGSRAKLDAFISLIKYRGIKGRLVEELDGFAKATQTLGSKRNRVVHDTWLMDEPERPIRREATASKHLRLLDIEVPTEEITTLLGAIVLHAMEFQRIAYEARMLLETSPGTSPETPPPSPAE